MRYETTEKGARKEKGHRLGSRKGRSTCPYAYHTTRFVKIQQENYLRKGRNREMIWERVGTGNLRKGRHRDII